MPENIPPKGTINIHVLLDGGLNLDSPHVLEKYIEKVFKAYGEFTTINNYFLYLKKINNPDKQIPNKDEIMDFYNKTFFKIGADFEGITSDAHFREILLQCECFADFVKLQSKSFKKKLMEYFFGFSYEELMEIQKNT